MSECPDILLTLITMVTVIYILQASQDLSSSLPSATVSCALVYLYIICEVWAAITLNNAHHQSNEQLTAFSLFIYLPIFISAVGVIILVSCVKVIIYLAYISVCLSQSVCLSVSVCPYVLLMCVVFLFVTTLILAAIVPV